MTKKSGEKWKHLKNILHETKSIIHNFSKAFSCQKLLSNREWTFKIKATTIKFRLGHIKRSIIKGRQNDKKLSLNFKKSLHAENVL